VRHTARFRKILGGNIMRVSRKLALADARSNLPDYGLYYGLVLRQVLC
jgi:hypothetical protein